LNNTVEFFKAAKKELHKVTWPDWQKVTETSLVVAGCTAIFAGYLWLVDIGISQLFSAVFYQ
jgi:preprotein translocase SecE subunit